MWPAAPLAALFPELTSTDMVVLTAIAGALSAAATAAFRMGCTFWNQAKDFFVPRLDAHLDALKTSLATQAEKQTQNEVHIGDIKGEIQGVHQTLKKHTVSLEWLAGEQMRRYRDTEDPGEA